jgi:hypothetical protein
VTTELSPQLRGRLVAAQAGHGQLRAADLDGLVHIVKRKLKKIQ